MPHFADTPRDITLDDITFGIEIETVELSRRNLAHAIQSVTGGEVRQGYRVVTPDGREWKAVSDGSLRSRNGYSGEVVSPIMRYSDLEQVQEIIRAIRRAGAKVNESCGIHIHVGADAFGFGSKNAAKTLKNLINICHARDEWIAKALGITSRRRNNWCLPVSSDLVEKVKSDRRPTLERLNVHWYGRENVRPTHYDSSRYHGLNLHNVWYRGTVEYRWFEATLHAGEIKAYVQFAMLLTARAINVRSARSAKREYSDATASYDWRGFLLDLGMIGDEFKTARLHLMKRMSGTADWNSRGLRSALTRRRNAAAE